LKQERKGKKKGKENRGGYKETEQKRRAIAEIVAERQKEPCGGKDCHVPSPPGDSIPEKIKR
jgi:hypothetical protein